MADFQSDLIDFDKDVDDYASGLATAIKEKGEASGSELDFGQRIRPNIDEVLGEFGLGFDYVDQQIGDVYAEDVLAVLASQGLTIDDVPFDEDDIREGSMQPDAVVGGCVTDYKYPPGALATPSQRSAALGQLASYMVATAWKQNIDVEDTVGVLVDGKNYIFVHGDDFANPRRRPVNDGSSEEFATLLIGHWEVLTADRLTSDFGAKKQLSADAVEALFKAFQDGGEWSEKLYDEWKLLFEQVCGFEFDKGREVLGEYYNIELENKEEFRQALFALYTYYALIAKLIAAEFVYYHTGSDFPSFNRRLVGRGNNELREEMEQFEDGWIFADAGITNFLEAGLFAWYTDEDVWTDDLASAIRTVAERMRKYDPGKLRDDPQETRDVFKNLYQHMVPEELRKQLGEVFTPDWLTDLTLEEAGYDGKGAILDPACGSGTFLVFAVRRKKEHYDLIDGNLSDSKKGELAETLLDEVEGFDLNPLAVLASRANVLIEFGELIDYCDNVELPVYLCDSIRPPASDTKLTGSFYEVNEVPANDDDDEGDDIEIKVPMEIIDRGLVNDYFDLANDCSKQEASTKVFIRRFENEFGIEKGFTRNSLEESYSDMHELLERDVDGVWWEVVKNRFRPRFTGEFDYVVGNPPYITVGDLPTGYRDDIMDEWEEYGITPNSGGGPRKGDHALLFACKSIEKYLEPGGTLSFLLPITVQRGGKADAFRKWLDSNTKVNSITDIADLDPFDVTRNRALILTVTKDEDNEFPVPCETWTGDSPDFMAFLEDVRSDTEQHDYVAKPLDGPGGKWFSGPQQALDAFEDIHGNGHYEAHEGINTIGGTGLFLADILNEQTRRVRNTDQGRTDWGKVTGQVDLELLFPATSGEEVGRWEYAVPDNIIIPHHSNGDVIPKDDFQVNFNDTYRFLYNDDLEKHVGDRKLYGTKLKNYDGRELHYLHAVGGRMFSKYKTVYKDISGGTYVDVQSATLEPMQYLGEEKPVMFTHTLMHIHPESKEEAYYLSGVLNSAPIRAMMRAHSVLHANPRAVEEMNIPKFDDSNDTHSTLAERSKQAHDTADRNDIEESIDELASSLFGVTDDQLDSIQQYLEDTQV